MKTRARQICLAAIVAVAWHAGVAGAQELAPRAYWPTPNGTNVFVLAYQNSSGDILTDPSPLVGVESNIDIVQFAYQRTFGLWGRTASLQLSQPFSRGETEGLVDGEFLGRTVSGVADTRVRLAAHGSVSTGAVTESGGDYDIVNLSYVYAW